MRSGSSRSFYLFIRRVIKQTAVITEAYHFCQFTYLIHVAESFLRS